MGMRRRWPWVQARVNTLKVVLDPQVHVAAEEAQAVVGQQGPGQQARLGEDLEPVADAQHQPAAAAWRITSCIIGLKRAMAPVRR
jgi:hypothetical protein